MTTNGIAKPFPNQLYLLNITVYNYRSYHTKLYINFLSIVSAAKVMRCIQCSLIYSADLVF